MAVIFHWKEKRHNKQWFELKIDQISQNLKILLDVEFIHETLMVEVPSQIGSEVFIDRTCEKYMFCS